MATNSNSETDPLTGQPKKQPAGSVINGLMGTSAPATGATASAPSNSDMTPQEASAAGLGWVDRNHPLWGTPGYVGSGGSSDGTADVHYASDGLNRDATGDPEQHYATDGLPGGAGGDATGDPARHATDGLPGDPQQQGEVHYQTDGTSAGGWPAGGGGSGSGGTPTGDPQRGSGPLGAGAGGAAPPVLPSATPSESPNTSADSVPASASASNTPTGGWDPSKNPPPAKLSDEGEILKENNPDSGVVNGGTKDIPMAPNTPPTVPTIPPRSAEMDALVKQLQARAAQSTVVDGTDPNVRRQADAFSAQQERSRRNYLSDQAEGNSPYSTGAQAGLERMTAEKAGQASGQFESELINRELTSRRTEIQQALESMGGILSDEEKNGLQRELSNLNASLETAKMNTQNNQFFAGLNQEDRQFLSQLTQNERFKGMDDTYKRMELAQNQSQFVSKLAQEGKLAELDDAFRKAQLSQQDSQFLKNLAQQGKFADMEDAYKKLALSQDQNQFIAKLAQEGKLAEMDDLFRRMKLMQEQSQFLDRLGFDTTQQQNYWDWMARGNGSSSSG